MKIAIVYDSSTGRTRQAAEAMGKIMEAHGHQCLVQSVTGADPTEVAKADLICIGGWVKGLMIILQHPSEGSLEFINQLGNLSGRKAIVFCTYLLAAGSTLRQMASALEGKGANVVGQFKYRGSKPDNVFATYAASLT
jgi:flavodoxin